MRLDNDKLKNGSAQANCNFFCSDFERKCKIFMHVVVFFSFSQTVKLCEFMHGVIFFIQSISSEFLTKLFDGIFSYDLKVLLY